jgi:solute carrier family 13 (sodium-dependent dicarboxylate transporter), member 2/3/5
MGTNTVYLPLMNKRIVKLLLIAGGPLLALLIVLFTDLTPGHPQTTYMGAIAVWVAWWWMTEAVAIAITALLPFILIPFAGIADPQTIALQYMDQAIFLFLGGFLISIGIEKWGLHRRLSLGILAKIGSSRIMVLAGVMGVTYFISMWISNTATVLMMMPAVLAIVKHLPEEEDNKGASKFAGGLLIALAYSATIGGMATLVGTPTNTIFYSYYNKNIEPEGLNFTNWFAVGFPVSIVLLIAVFFVMLLMFSGQKKQPLNKQFFIDQYRTLGLMGYEEKVIAILFATTATLWFTRANIDFGAFTFQGWGDLVGGNTKVHDSTVSVIMGGLLFLIPSKKEKGSALLVTEDFKKVPYSVLLLFGSGFALAKGFELSGLSVWLAGHLATIGSLHPLLIIVSIVTIVCIISELASNVASIQLALPILASLCASTGLPAMEIMLPATLAASLGFMLPVATAANTIVYSSGYFKSQQMVRAGFWADLLGIVIISVLCWMMV